MNNIHRITPEGSAAAGPRSFASDFVVIDVKDGRNELLKRIKHKGEKVRVLIVATIDTVHSNDDGESREFSASVEHIREIGPIAHPY